MTLNYIAAFGNSTAHWTSFLSTRQSTKFITILQMWELYGSSSHKPPEFSFCLDNQAFFRPELFRNLVALHPLHLLRLQRPPSRSLDRHPQFSN